MPTPPSPITIPSSLTYRSTENRVLPLTNLELDGNFAYLESLSESRLLVDDFNATNIILKLNDGENGYPAADPAAGLNVSTLRGSAPSSTSVGNTVVLRDSSGSFQANVITANSFIGRVSEATTASGADKLNTSRSINGVLFDGTADVTVYDDTKLNKTGDVVTGKLTLGNSLTNSTLLRVHPIASEPETLENGDIWVTATAQYNRIGGITRTVAYTDSNISGSATNVTGVVQIANGGTGSNNAVDARQRLGVASSGDNSDITVLSGLTTALSASQGGTGLKTTGPAGNVLTSNGNGTWSSAEPSFIPAGAVMAFAMSSPPTGWLECNGATVSRAVYAKLFAAIGTRYGATDSSSFVLPDMRGTFVRGWDNGRGFDGAREFGSYQDDSIRAHNHLFPGDSGLSNANNVAGWTYRSVGNFNYSTHRVQTVTGNVLRTSDIGTNETRPKNIAMMYCIKI